MDNSQNWLAGKRCLVLDDEFLIALDLHQLFESAGAIVTSVASATEALGLLNGGQSYDLAVLDVKLGGAGESSMAVAQRLAAGATPVIFLTGMRVDPALAQQFANAQVLEKPYDPPALFQAVRRVLAFG
ncbi:MAG TPA: response regulator [Pseudolabrys sp.]|nr:response regulator [Pseudolabrys sp.]